MSMFPRFTQEFSPLFRLLDDYDRASRSTPFAQAAQGLRSFTPKFDVVEKKENYELHGELPGIAQENINIEWSDSNTLTISGRVEHRSERGERPRGFIEAEEHNEQHYHKPTVEDEQPPADGTSSQEVAKTNQNKDVGKPTDEAKYWVSERSVGEFHRSFSFPGRVDQENVKASLKDGVLSILVPKAQAPKSRRINIE
ncbi:putative 30 kda heat shock protein [Lasiodiplodia theobromae]|uniref:30 kDa heat shock protein n=2 Tax=Lasiodiplodia TaxID=66739 RepID=A0A5N5DKW3_9PEZI|nr:Heat shock protein [Lasiodiplodia theobromae]KAB2578525.1 30 kDa heat shock protein [Lasiodiplodia theobromae]KAF4538523.1 Heat shock protein [Lasiodiplodia theobromae]KAF9640624.1 putative 30 kda heat shock protein [Lasiodiplodia theobromae]KAK0659256.1 30 kDa heat shock protein [Lasiodiplodia hormozganensis]